MRKAQHFVKAVLFVLLFSGVLFCLSRVFSRPHALFWAEETGMDLVHRYKRQYDICFAGTSIVIANVSNQELYEKYGIAAVSVGEPLQPLFLTKYVIEEVLQYQRPKAVVVDTRGLFYSEEDIRERVNENEEGIVHYALDSIHSPGIKLKAVKEIRERYKDVNYKEYCFSLYNNHFRWKDLSETNFRGYGDSVCMNGNVMLTDLHAVNGEIETNQRISKENERDLLLIKEACEKYGTELVLMTGYLEPELSKREQLRAISEKDGIEYLDINAVAEEIGFREWMQSDYIHFNVAGACLWSDYLGRRFNDRYSVTEYSKGLRSLYHQQQELHKEYLDHVKTKRFLMKKNRFKPFLQKAAQLDLRDYSIFVAVYDDAFYQLDEEGRELLKKLGLKGPECFRGSYAGVCLSEKISQKNSEDERVELSGTSGTLTYHLESAGANCKDGAMVSIKVDDEEYARGTRGFNIMVYDNKLQKAVLAESFDTFADPDPLGS